MDAKRYAEIRARHEADVRLYAKFSVPHEHMDPCYKDRATLLAALDEARAQLRALAQRIAFGNGDNVNAMTPLEWHEANELAKRILEADHGT